jgi:uncharacterized protein (TIGR02147 family)
MNVFEYSDVKSFLKAYIANLPKRGRGQIKRIATHLNVSSTLISQILSGQKSLTLDQAHTLTIYLGLVDVEADYFMALSQYERAGPAGFKKYWSKKISELGSQSLKLSNRIQREGHILTETERSIYYSSHLYAAVRLYASVGDKGHTLQNLAERFELPLLRCAEILKFLVQTDFCHERNGLFFMGRQSTHLEKGSPHLLRFQADWRLKAIQSAESLTDEELMFTGPVSLSKSDFKMLREQLVQTIKSFLETVHASPAEEIACLNVDWIWIRK